MGDYWSRLLTVVFTSYLQFLIWALPMAGLASFARDWAPSPDFWQQKWTAVLDAFGHNQRVLFGMMPSVVSGVVYWTVSGLFMLIDFSGLLAAYKVQPGTNQPPSAPRLSNAARVVFVNQVVGFLFGLVAFEFGRWLNGREIDPEVVAVLPSIPTMLQHLMLTFAFREIFFYYSHRLLHHRLFYKRFHKQHHEWTAPIALIAAYCHPLEHIVSNVLPVAIGPVVLKSHPLISWSWFVLVTCWTLTVHSGYHLPLAPCPEFHDFHHQMSNQNYGVVGILDALHKTDLQWRNTQSFERSFILFGLRPSRQVLDRTRIKKQ
ncbi:Hypothetical predicted protein [Cloeon dipterum]|uniref:Fatty acid hydroxylase domain-containing protein n=2 Tax=Cloeon dipterum TaxID=197152 RepID=A0A8S1C618_9INSE|nr:Hypothetical predicted protein [Cloeon dipterum]